LTLSGVFLRTHLDPYTVVAHGAAYYAGILSQKLASVVLSDVAPLDSGIAVANEKNRTGS